ncbi:MAG: hypothetical protein Aurels2KO_17700 [Aureliella sp.]
MTRKYPAENSHQQGNPAALSAFGFRAVDITFLSGIARRFGNVRVARKNARWPLHRPLFVQKLGKEPQSTKDSPWLQWKKG